MARYRSSSGQRRVGTPRKAIGAVTAMVLFAISACSSSGSSSRNATTDAPGVSEAQARIKAASEPATSYKAELAKVDATSVLKGKKVLIVPSASFIFSAALTSIKEALGALGVQSQVCDGKFQPSEITACLQAAQTLKVAGVITIAVGPRLVPNAYRELSDAGIPTYSAWQNPEGTPETDILRFGDSIPALESSLKLASDYSLAHAKSGNELMLGVNDNVSVADLVKTWQTYGEKLCTDCNIDLKSVTTSEKDQVKDIVASKVLKTPDLRSIEAFNLDVFGPEVLSGLGSSTTKPLITGNGSGGVSLGLLKQGRIDAVALTSMYYTGWTAVDGLVRLVAKSPAVTYPPVVRLFDSSNIGEVNTAPENEGSFAWFGQPAFIDAFKGAWGIA